MTDLAKVPDCEEIDALKYEDEMKWDFDDLKFCAHCFDSMESVEDYQSHFMYTLGGTVECPKLRREGCPRCGDIGDKAHIGERCYKTKRRVKPNKKEEPLRIKLLRKLTEKRKNKKRTGDFLIAPFSKKAKKL